MSEGLFYDTLLEVFGEVGADVLSGTFDSHLFHIMVDHKFDELFERCFGCRIPP